MISKARKRQIIGLCLGLMIALPLLGAFFLPGMERLHVRGPMNVGHEELTCDACHTKAVGTLRQQLQANVRHVLGMRKTGATFGHNDVDNANCLECHSRPNDRHPVFRFFEPRFKDARKNIQPQYCVSCHREHTGKLVTMKPTFCENCHQNLELKVEIIDVPHATLVAESQWDSCLGCHDFHGNHEMETAKRLENTLSRKEILDYFNGAPSPYSDKKFYRAKKEIQK